MNILEKILEEIKEAFDENIDDIEDSAGIHHFAIDSFTAWYIARKIIRSHMDEVADNNDGWISVEERLPEARKYENGEPIEFIVMTKGAEVPCSLSINDQNEWFSFAEALYAKKITEYNVMAWKPYPKPYRRK